MLKKLKFLIIVFVLAALFFPGFAKLQELKQKLSDTEEKLSVTQKRNAFLEDRITQLKTNQESLEIVAREKMGVVKKGETVLKIVTESEEAPVAENTTAANVSKP